MDADLGRNELLQGLAELEEMFQFRQHLAVHEMPIESLSGKSVLEIGCGAGAHSALFALHGAHVTSVDITFDRAHAGAQKFFLLGDKATGCIALQGDAEALPLLDASFDIVYSNGVLHHTPETERALDEVFRVLKPGGQAVIMLYCKSSFQYWFNLWFCVGVLCGKLFTNPNWLGRSTEWIGNSPQKAFNPITRCYTASEILSLFQKFETVSLRKSEFYFGMIPKLGRLYRRWQARKYGSHPGGKLVYGSPWPIWSPLEQRLGKVMGWCWNIQAHKRNS